MTTQPATSSPPPDKKQKERSPGYPGISLRRAVELVQKLWESDKRQPVMAVRAATNLGFSAKSSAGMIAIAALKKYGLLDEEGAGEGRKVKLTELAISILNPSHPHREQLIKEASLKPAVLAELWAKYGADGLPSDGTLRDYLVFERKFTEEAAKQLIGNFRDTITFAKLASSDKVILEGEGEENTPPAAQTAPSSAVKQPQPPLSLPTPPTPPTMNAIPGLIDFPVPLPSGAVAYYRLPSSVSEADFTFYQSLLAALKTGLVKPSAPAELKEIGPEQTP